jgi:cation diffusion facilitator CzcD-associated flavoprotein CzcO
MDEGDAMSSNGSSNGSGNGSRAGGATAEVDVVVVGAGFAGMYLLHQLRQLGFSAKVIETGDDVGGTWYWNRYPGARVDIQSVDYSYSWDPELEREWQWSEKYSPQPEILRYAQYVADKHDLRRDIEFGTRVDAAAWDDDAQRWHVRTSRGEDITCRFYVMATGTLSAPKDVDIEGSTRFGGEVSSPTTGPTAVSTSPASASP